MERQPTSHPERQRRISAGFAGRFFGSLTLRMTMTMALAIVSACSGCGKTSGSETSPSPTVTVNAASGSYPFSVEIADTESERATGLMNRTELAGDAGMIFVWDTDVLSSFWMKDTLISLDMLFIDSEKSVVFIQPNATPLSTELITPTSSYRYVLEVAAGFVDRAGVAVGDTVELNL